MRRYIGIDPGDRWVGYAKLTVNGSGHKVKIYMADMGLIDRKLATNLIYVVDSLLSIEPVNTTIIAENFQIRPQGFNAFRTSNTLRLLGALNYVALKKGLEWREVNPSRADLDKMYIGKYLKRWSKWLPAGEWDHAWSAWRVMVNWMMRSADENLTSLRLKPITLPKASYNHTYAPKSAYIVAPTMTWEIER